MTGVAGATGVTGADGVAGDGVTVGVTGVTTLGALVAPPVVGDEVADRRRTTICTSLHLFFMETCGPL